MKNYIIKKLKRKRITIGIIGLGYVGLPLARTFSKKINVIGFDIDKKNYETKKRNKLY